MACPAPFDRFRLATEYLPDIAYTKGVVKNPFIDIPMKGEYPQGAGLNLSTFRISRSVPSDSVGVATDEPEFVPITLTEGATYTGSCGTTYNQMNVGYKESFYGPEGFGWKGIPVCSDDLIYNHKAAAFLAMYIPAMIKNTIQTIADRMQAIYGHFVPKAVANDDFHFVDGGTGAPPRSPVLTLEESTCALTQQMLDTTKVILDQEGAYEPNARGWITNNGGHKYPLYIGEEASNQILINNPEFRRDIRYGDMGAGIGGSPGALLLRELGEDWTLKGFHHIKNLFPPRYTYSGGAYHRVPTWLNSTNPLDATKGVMPKLNPVWLAPNSSPFEGAYVLNPWVFKSNAIRPVNAAADVNWPAKSYMGELYWKVGGSKIFDPPCFDPLEKLGIHFAEYKHAPEPIFPEYGRLIIFRRCPISYTCIGCS